METYLVTVTRRYIVAVEIDTNMPSAHMVSAAEAALGCAVIGTVDRSGECRVRVIGHVQGAAPVVERWVAGA